MTPERRTSDVIVVGAGVIGCSIALALAQSGRRVLVVDKAGGMGYGSTSASSALVRFNYSTDAAVALSWEARHAWGDWAGHLGHVDPGGLARFHRTGMLVLGERVEEFAATIARFETAGVPHEIWDAATLAERLPALDPHAYGPPRRIDDDAFWGEAHGDLVGLVTPDAGQVDDPRLAAQNLGVAAQALGAQFVLRRRVVALDATGPGWVLRLDDGGELAAPAVVNAAGPWSGPLNDLAGVSGGIRLGVRPLRQEVHEAAAPAGLMTLADADLGYYAKVTPGGRLVLGSLEPECDPLEWIDDPDTVSPRATAENFETQLTRAARRMPELAVPPRPSGIVGVYDVTDDWTPIYDRTDAPGFYLAMGTSGNQFKNAPVVGLVLRTLMDAVESGHDHDRDPVQVRMPVTGLSVDLGVYSRRREVPEGAPANVLG